MSLSISNSRLRLPLGHIFWREVGQGLPLIFLHGSFQDSTQWLEIIKELGTDYHCLAPDIMGSGDSPAENAHYSVAWQVECLEAYLEALNLKQVYLIGHSLGAWIAASYTLKHLDQVQGLILLSPEGVAVKGHQKTWLWERFLIGCPPIIVWLWRSLLPLGRILGFVAYIQQILHYRQRLLDSTAITQLLFQRRHGEITAELLQDHLPQLNVPTLIIQSLQDQPDQVARNQIYLQSSPTAQLKIISQEQPDLSETVPNPVLEAIREFLMSRY